MRIPLDPLRRKALVVPLVVCGPTGKRFRRLRAAVDTAASTTLIPPGAARALGYSLDGAESERIASGGSVFDAPRIVLDRVDQDRAAPLEPPILPGRTAEGLAGSRRSRRTVVTDRVDVGPASARGVEALCHDLPRETGLDALVGLSFLTRFDVRFDFGAWEMHLEPRAAKSAT